MNDSDPDALADAFHDRLHERTPVAWATLVVVAANVGLFLAMAARGDNGLTADARRLAAWGANFGPLTRSGEWWRLLTAAFLHAGILHLALNMIALRSGGPLLERSIGSAGFLSLYLLCAVGAGLGSLTFSGTAVSVGASGAVFGVYGALLGLALHHRPRGQRLRSLRPTWPLGARSRSAGSEGSATADREANDSGGMPPHLAERMAAQIVLLFVLNLAIDLAIPGIDNAAHVTGFTIGLLVGWMGAPDVARRLRARTVPPPAEPTRSGALRVLPPAAVVVSIVLLASAVFPRLPSRTRIAILDTACHARLGSACLAAGREVQRTGGARGLVLATTYFERGCAPGHAGSCAALGLAYIARGPSGAPLAALAFARGCERHDVGSCRALAALFETGNGVERDLRRATQIHRQMCDRGDAFSCFRLGEAYKSGRGVGADARRAAALATNACDAGEPRGCTLYAELLTGAGDRAKALLVYERACKANEPVACAALGARYEAGDGVPADPGRAANDYYSRACAAGLALACARAGAIVERAEGSKDPSRAARLYERGCALGHAEACFNLGLMYAEGRGREKDLTRALALYQQACRRGLKQVCALAAQLAGTRAATEDHRQTGGPQSKQR